MQALLKIHSSSPGYRGGLKLLCASALALCASLALAQEVKLQLSGDAEVPAVETTAVGSGTFKIAPDKSLTGNVTTTGIMGTMAHIHEGAAGANGRVLIPLQQDGAGKWAVPPGTKLSEEQYTAFKAGKLYVNVHSAAHPGGEIRAQLKP